MRDKEEEGKRKRSRRDEKKEEGCRVRCPRRKRKEVKDKEGGRKKKEGDEE